MQSAYNFLELQLIPQCHLDVVGGMWTVNSSSGYLKVVANEVKEVLVSKVISTNHLVC